MANYTENFTSVTGDAVDASELEAEFDAIATAIATKINVGESTLTDTFFHARRESAADQLFAAGSATKVEFDDEVSDVGNNYNDTGSGLGQYGYTVPETGIYLFVLGLGTSSAASSGDNFASYFYWDQGGGEDTPVVLKTGVQIQGASGTTNILNINATMLQSLTSGDIIFPYCLWNGTDIDGITGTNSRSFFMGGRIG